MTIQTKTEVELRTARASWTTLRASRERNAASPVRTATSTAPPKPTRMRASEAPVCVHTSPEPTMSANPRTTESGEGRDRKSTRLNSSHGYISYAVFCLKKKKKRKKSIVRRDNIE